MTDSNFDDLVNQLKAENRMDRERAIKALVESENNRVATALISALKEEEDEYNREVIIQFLGKQGDYRAKDPLLEIWLDEDEYREIRESAAFSLVELGDLRMFQYRKEKLPWPSIPWFERDAIKLHSIESELALLKIFVYYYNRELSDEVELKYFFSSSTLTRALDDEDHEIRRAAAEILSTN